MAKMTVMISESNVYGNAGIVRRMVPLSDSSTGIDWGE